MTVGDTIIAFGLLAIIVVLTCEACWRARVPRWHGPRLEGPRLQGPRGAIDSDASPRRIRNALGAASSTHRVEGHQGK